MSESEPKINRIRRNKYKKINEQIRLEIIKRIIDEGEQLKTVADSIGINVSTCKAIVKVYQEEGRVGKKKTRNKVVDVLETYSFYVLENSKMIEICPSKLINSNLSVENKEMVAEILSEKCEEKGKKMLTEAFLKYQTKLQENGQSEGDLSIDGGRMFEFGSKPFPY